MNLQQLFRRRRPRRPRNDDHGWGGLEPLEGRVLMSADSLALAADPGAETRAGVFEKQHVNESDPERARTVQYRETDFNFVVRLMEEEVADTSNRRIW